MEWRRQYSSNPNWAADERRLGLLPDDFILCVTQTAASGYKRLDAALLLTPAECDAMAAAGFYHPRGGIGPDWGSLAVAFQNKTVGFLRAQLTRAMKYVESR